ncbi:MAG: 4-alpha-glucanotransferase [Pontiellaceae bacterium]|jgi:4-alpha-glucanotransferase|nr:4-alpha-glucanotransferase [Pontiellaceae bacterium]
MNFERKSGVLLHISSLPGRWGMGEIGPQARAFGKLLVQAGQKIWQILPTGPIGYGYSPYSSLSSFAGNHLFISFDELIEEGLLTKRQLSSFPSFDPHQIDFPAVIAAREKVLFRVADRFAGNNEFDAFCRQEAEWLPDYALFMAVREDQGSRPWIEWPDALRDREFQTLEKMRKKLAKKVRRHEVLQYFFSKHWKKTADFLHGAGISIVGDLPIFVADDSADVWANRELFFLGQDGRPTVVAGVPPDYFSETGQRWGNPLYDWAAHRAGAYKWWTQRMRHSLAMTDMVRIDHFRGFEDYWEIPAEEPTAVRGRWVKGPGLELFRSVEKHLRRGSDSFPGFGKNFRLSEHVIAENLGIITDEVEALREACAFPGMWVLQFQFDAKPMEVPDYYPEGMEKNWVVYTGTHDNDTTEGWLKKAGRAERQRVRNYLMLDREATSRDLIELALRAPAKLAVIPLQDLLGLGSEARMNTPATTVGNWSWRFSEDMVRDETVRWLNDATVRNGRG